MGPLGESRYGTGTGREDMDMIYLNISTGIGARVIFDGHLYRRSRSVAGEFGHFIIGIGVGSPLDSRAGVVFAAPYLPPFFASCIEY